MCRCGHSQDAHTHLHAKTYCGTCTCDRYRPRYWWQWW
jgi:hypothetical protein